MIRKLPGQSVKISTELGSLLTKAQSEIKREITFSGTPLKNFIGRVECREIDVLIEISSNLTPQMAEYVAGHELGHVLQLARGCAIVSGRTDEPRATIMATAITDFVTDPLADTLASQAGLPMARCYETWINSTGFLSIFDNEVSIEKYSDDWHSVWKTMTSNKVDPEIELDAGIADKNYWTMYISLDIAKLIVRAENLGLSLGNTLLRKSVKIDLLNRTIKDIIKIGCAKNINQAALKIDRILDYFEGEPGHLFLNKPLTKEFIVNGRWKRLPSNIIRLG